MLAAALHHTYRKTLRFFSGMYSFAKFLIGFCLLFAISCGPSIPAPHAGLTNEGVLLLSPDNPYLGTNRYLAGELEKSTILLNFMEQRGGPQAIKVTRPRLGSRLTTIYLFYPQQREFFTAEIDESLRKNPKFYEEWVIKGPFQTARQDFRMLRQMTGDPFEPVFILHGERHQFKESMVPKEEKTRPTLVVAEIARPTPTPTPPKPKVEVPLTPEDAIDLLMQAPPGKFRALNTDELAIAMSKGYAEREANGDLVHSVRFNGESVDAIVKWYTGDLSNKPAILESNKLAADATLKGGDRLIVPFALLKNVHIMPSDYYVE